MLHGPPGSNGNKTKEMLFGEGPIYAQKMQKPRHFLMFLESLY